MRNGHWRGFRRVEVQIVRIDQVIVEMPAGEARGIAALSFTLFQGSKRGTQADKTDRHPVQGLAPILKDGPVEQHFIDKNVVATSRQRGDGTMHAKQNTAANGAIGNANIRRLIHGCFDIVKALYTERTAHATTPP